MWKCPNCETINNTDVCYVCGERRVLAAHVIRREEVNNNNSPVIRADNYSNHREEVPAEKRTGLIAMIIILSLVLILAIGGFIGYGAYTKRMKAELNRGISYA